MSGRTDHEFLEDLLSEDSRRAGVLLGMHAKDLAVVLAFLVTGVFGLAGLHHLLEGGSRRTQRPPARHRKLPRGSLSPARLAEMTLQPILEMAREVPPPPPSLVPAREPDPAVPGALLGATERDARRYLAVISRQLVQTFEVPALEDLDVIASQRTDTLPAFLNLIFLERRLKAALDEAGLDPARLTREAGEKGAGALVLRLGEADAPGFTQRLEKPRAKGRVALVVDDAGYGGPSTRRLLAIRAPMTVAILPFYPGTRAADRLANKRGQDTILHMPFQPKGAHGKYRKHVVINRQLEAAEIRRRVTTALEQMPQVQGMNNHMGSLGTESWFVCAEALGVIAERGLFFVDSLTSSRSVAYESARKLGIPTARRNTAFLDNDPTKAGVDKAFAALLAQSGRNQDLLAILHDKPESVASMEEAVPGFRERGVELAFAAEMLR